MKSEYYRLPKYCRYLLLLAGITLNQSGQAQQIKVVTEYFPPFQFVNEQGKLDGYSTEVVRELFALTGDNPNFEVLPWARSYVMALQQKNVMIYSIVHNDIRHPLFHWVGALANEHLYFWGLKSHYPQVLSSLDEVKSKVIVASTNSNPDQYMSEHGFSHIYRVTDADQGLGMLFRERVDLITGTELDMERRAKALGFDFSMMTKVYALQEMNHQLCIAFNRDSDPALVSRYRQAFKQLQQQQRLQSLRKKWGIPE